MKPDPGSSTPPAPKASEVTARGVGRAVVAGVVEAGRPLHGFVHEFGEHLLLLVRCFYWLFRPPYRPRQFVEAGQFIGLGSLPIISLVGTFSGMVTSLQMVNAFRILKAEAMAGSAVGISLAVELAPVLTGLMLCGRVAAGIATELGTMRITEQIDALETMAVSPIQYLIVPRLVMGTVMGPILTFTFFTVGMFGAYFVAVVVMGVDHGSFVENFKWYVDPVHIAQGLIKATVFGLTITLIGCKQGYHATGGGRGVGLSTTRAVVVGSVVVLVLDFFLSDILLAVLPTTT